MNKDARQQHSIMQDERDKPKASHATDPVCGMEVDTEDAERLEKDGNVRYFCSAECREQYEASPDDFDG